MQKTNYVPFSKSHLHLNHVLGKVVVLISKCKSLSKGVFPMEKKAEAYTYLQ